jgi:hypothetical protein
MSTCIQSEEGEYEIIYFFFFLVFSQPLEPDLLIRFLSFLFNIYYYMHRVEYSTKRKIQIDFLFIVNFIHNLCVCVLKIT